MGHHSSDEPSDEMIAAMKRMNDDLKKEGIEQKVLAAESPKFGATGEYPEPPIDRTDEGQIIFGVTSHRGKIILNFGKPVAWMGMDAHQATELAAMLLKHAARCRDIGPEQKSEAKAKEHAG